MENSNDDLAAALFYLLGEPVPYNSARLDEAKRILREVKDHDKQLLKIIELCGKQKTPKQLYLACKAYSWLGKKYYKDAARCATEYLRTPGWKELPSRTKIENGIRIDYAASGKAAVLADLAKAQEGLNRLEDALASLMEAYRIAPHSAMYAVKASDTLARLRGKEEALLFLMQQTKSKYYSPVRYTDLQGRTRVNDLFKQLLDAHIRKMSNKEQQPDYTTTLPGKA